ncbi:aminotransferase class I/II-fold pyridoxal phosphate-dependent enzyme [Streptomyces sp. NPDC005533]|uniref:aminotransferase class I/II-fold pyridoxal phosphate-dependent enzyme n=1 Tax=Streptomyces sp. NPDC005533 TaxID=3364723 RepID=UPI0036D1EAC3
MEHLTVSPTSDHLRVSACAPLPALPQAQSHFSQPGETGWHRTPLADALLTLAHKDVTSFHALPLSHGDSLGNSSVRERYTALFGAAHLACDVSYSGAMLDSYFRPRGPLLQAQRLAAQAFRADHTYLLSGGTSTANRVALGALASPGDRVLADRSCHQSVHFTLPTLGVDVDYAPVRGCCEHCPREFADLPRLLQMYAQSHQEGRPYRTVVLSAVSYDGIRYNLPAVLGAIAKIGSDVRVVIDEAWGAAHNFHPALRPLTALEAFHGLRRSQAAGHMQIAVTHSAHKSLSALRQGSYLHLIGTPALQERVEQELFQQHTTSPSWPILASLDLARAQALTEGEQLVQRSIDFAQAIRTEIETDPELSSYEILGSDRELLDRLLVDDDPVRIMVSVKNLGISASELRRKLFEEHGLYIARECGEAVLLHIHIGVDETAVHRLLEALRTIQKSQQAAPGLPEDTSDHFIIAYPPGIPIAVPGEPLNAERRQEIAHLRAEGSEIYTLHGRRVYNRDQSQSCDQG